MKYISIIILLIDLITSISAGSKNPPAHIIIDIIVFISVLNMVKLLLSIYHMMKQDKQLQKSANQNNQQRNHIEQLDTQIKQLNTEIKT